MEDAATYKNLWTFSLTSGITYGLLSRHDESTYGGTKLRRRDFSCAQDEGHVIFPWTLRTTLDPGASYRHHSYTRRMKAAWITSAGNG